MITAILLLWIGIKLNAGVWYYVLLGIGAFMRIIKSSWKMYKCGLEAE